MDGASRSRRSFMNSMKFSFPWNLVKFASVWSVLATRVRFLAAFSFGYSAREYKHTHFLCCIFALTKESHNFR